LAVENNHPKKTGGGKRCCGILSPFQIVGETEKRRSTKPFTGTRKSLLIFTGPWFENGDKFTLQQHMSSGPGYYEGELYNIIRNGRGVPAVPLVVIGVDV
jgi:hypothetical protein